MYLRRTWEGNLEDHYCGIREGYCTLELPDAGGHAHRLSGDDPWGSHRDEPSELGGSWQQDCFASGSYFLWSDVDRHEHDGSFCQKAGFHKGAVELDRAGYQCGGAGVFSGRSSVVSVRTKKPITKTSYTKWWNMLIIFLMDEESKYGFLPQDA